MCSLKSALNNGDFYFVILQENGVPTVATSAVGSTTLEYNSIEPVFTLAYEQIISDIQTTCRTLAISPGKTKKQSLWSPHTYLPTLLLKEALYLCTFLQCFFNHVDARVYMARRSESNSFFISHIRATKEFFFVCGYSRRFHFLHHYSHFAFV